MNSTKKQPLFLVIGASCVGKSTACNLLFEKESEYLVMESDLLWNNVYNTPEDNFCEYRRVWLRVAAHISQIGKPVVLCGSADPEQFEHQPERELFSNLYYLAIVCDGTELEKRMRCGRRVTDERWIKSSLEYNAWLKENADKTNPPITLLDNTRLSFEETAKVIEKWIAERM